MVGVLFLCGVVSCALVNFARDVMRQSGEARFNADASIGSGRINLLLLGIDERANEHGPWRTDTLILLTVDPATLTAGLLSIPRDLWVPVPGLDREARINTAHFIGDAENYPGGGPALAMETVQYNLGLPVKYYVRINFTAFEKIIDWIGGIDVYVEQAIDDPAYPDDGWGYDPLHIPAGWQHMDGHLALKYARTRHTELGDFDRAHRQQKAILAVRDKIMQSGIAPTLVGQAGPLIDMLGNSIQTNLTLDQLVYLIDLGSRIDASHIQMLAIGPAAATAYQAPSPDANGKPQDVLLPNRDEIRKLRDQLLDTRFSAMDDAARLAAEAATLRIENGTLIVGLASRTQSFLTGRGFTVNSIGDAFDGSTGHAETLIIDYTGKPFTASKLAAALNLPLTAIRTATALGDGVDVRVTLGSDFAAALGAQLMQTPAP